MPVILILSLSFGLLPAYTVLFTFADRCTAGCDIRYLITILFFVFAYQIMKSKILSPEHCIQALKNMTPSSRVPSYYNSWISNLPGSSPFHNRIMYFSVLFPCYFLSPKYPSSRFKIWEDFLVPYRVSSKFLFFSRAHFMLHYYSYRQIWKHNRKKKKGTFKKAYFKNNLPSFFFNLCIYWRAHQVLYGRKWIKLQILIKKHVCCWSEITFLVKMYILVNIYSLLKLHNYVFFS